jgi:diamine N-acetyltransferase
MVTSTTDGPLIVRRAGEADVERLTVFAERTFRDAFQADNSPDDMDAYCRTAFTVDAYRQYLSDPAIDTLIVEDLRGTVVAYAQLRPGAPPKVQKPAPLELWRFYVDRAHHGRGVAQRLMVALMEAARVRGAETIWLGVWERNHRAQAFYRKMGFVDAGSHSFLLGTDVQTDRLMVRPVSQ